MLQYRASSMPSFTRRAFISSLACAALCAGLPGRASATGPLLVLAATYPAYMACATLTDGLDGIRLDLLVEAQTGCPHDYSMTPQDRMKLEDADVLVLNGGGFESFLSSSLLASLSCTVVDASRCIQDSEEAWIHDKHAHARTAAHWKAHGEASAEVQDVDAHGHHHGGNPHYFTSPACFAIMVRTIAEVLACKLPHLAQVLKDRAVACAAKMAALSSEIKALHGENVHLVLQHDTMAWFFRTTRFTVDAVLQEEGDEPPSAASLVGLIKHMKEGGKYLLIGEPQFPSQLLDTLAAETGAPRVVLDPMVSGNVPMPADFYESTMRANVERLKAVLAK